VIQRMVWIFSHQVKRVSLVLTSAIKIPSLSRKTSYLQLHRITRKATAIMVMSH